jgi:hypothetical protein
MTERASFAQTARLLAELPLHAGDEEAARDALKGLCQADVVDAAVFCLLRGDVERAARVLCWAPLVPERAEDAVFDELVTYLRAWVGDLSEIERSLAFIGERRGTGNRSPPPPENPLPPP